MNTGECARFVRYEFPFVSHLCVTQSRTFSRRASSVYPYVALFTQHDFLLAVK